MLAIEVTGVLAIVVTGAVTDAGREGRIVLGAVTGVVAVVVRRVVAKGVTRVLTGVVKREENEE